MSWLVLKQQIKGYFIACWLLPQQPFPPLISWGQSCDLFGFPSLTHDSGGKFCSVRAKHGHPTLPLPNEKAVGLVPVNVWWGKICWRVGDTCSLFMRLKEDTSSPSFPRMLSCLDMMPGTATVTLWPWGAVCWRPSLHLRTAEQEGGKELEFLII